MKQALEWIMQYNKAFTAFFGVPLITYLVQNLIMVLQKYGVTLPVGTDMELVNGVHWLIGLVLAGVVYQIPNKGK